MNCSKPARRILRSLQRGLRIESLEDRRVLDSTVVFNEIMYNPVGAGDAGAEWIELYNQLRVDMDISEWELSGGVEFQFPDGTIVPGREHVIIAADPVAFEASTGKAAHGPWNGSLSNAGEEIRLYNNDQRLMNVVDYDDAGDWPAAPDGAGVTLAKTDRNSDSARAENWTFSAQLGGTPGDLNFPIASRVESATLVDSGSAATAFVPSDDSLGNDWLDVDFDDSGWLTGTTGVGFDQGTRGSNYRDLLGLNFDEPGNGQDPSPMRDVNSTAYVRVPFEIPADGSTILLAVLRMRYEDGFVAYINGVEVVRGNAPADDELTWNSSATASRASTDAVSFVEFRLSDYDELLQPGANVLAIHALNASVSDKDVLIDAQLLTKSKQTFEVLESVDLVINEVDAADSDAFFIEILNRDDAVVDLAGYALLRPGQAQPRHELPSRSLAPGQRLTVTAVELGTDVRDGDRLLLVDPSDMVLDGVRIADQAQARAWDWDGRWMLPSRTSPGVENEFSLQHDIVINEIMYHPAPQAAVPDVPSKFETDVVVPFTSEAWRFNDTGAELPADWHQQTYTDWTQGQAPIGFDSGDLEVPINTVVTKPSQNDPPFLTYYFQTEFQIAAENIDQLDQLTLTHTIDDGAVFYLNGVEVLRFNMPSGPITPADPAISTVPNAVRVGQFELPVELLVAGTNTLSAEVHLSTPNSSDVAFAAELASGKAITPPIPGTPFQEREDLEWFELFNRGDDSVDLSGWQVTDGINYVFPQGTRIAPQSYLVVARDVDAFRSIYANVDAIGDYSGRLGNRDDRIRLLDGNLNLADEVHYYEGGDWPVLADGGGSSLELMDADADNRNADVWAASDEADRGEWTEYSFEGISQRDVFFEEEVYNELVLGILNGGEFLIDDIEVVMDPEGAAIPLIQNGTFEADAIGAAPDKWRLIGNHSGTVVADPTDPQNHVLHVVATGAQGFVHDHLETTFVDNTQIVDWEPYSISYRVKWLAGSNQLNSRLWFNRLSNTMPMDRAQDTGTPGAANSTSVANVGPTFSDFGHVPTTPLDDQEVTVEVQADDPDNVDSVNLWWRENGKDWSTVAMTGDSRGVFDGQIPPHSAGAIIQFYVEAVDALGASSTYPADGADSRALFQVEDGVDTTSDVDRFRWIMLDEDKEPFTAPANRMSNWFTPVTFVHNETPYYDVEMRLVGSRFARPGSGYKVRLHPHNPLYGVHDSVRFDLNGTVEILFKQMINRAGGGSKSSNYDDMGYLVSHPRGQHTLVQLARYEDVFLNEQFANGSDGTKWELDDVVVPSLSNSQTDIEAIKEGTLTYEQGDIGISGTVVEEQGDNPEFFRAHLLIKNNRELDDFESISRLATAIHQHGDKLFEATNEVMDVDAWMRYYAYQAYFGAWDSYGFTRPKNLRIYLRPEDNKFVPLMWDADLSDLKARIKPSTSESRLDEMRDIPHNLRLFWGHMLDMMDTAFNVEYVAPWVIHYRDLVLNNHNNSRAGTEFDTFTELVRKRTEKALEELEEDIPRADFTVTTNNGEDLNVDTPAVIIDGKGWVDVRHIRLAGSDQPLSDFWPETDSWQVEVPLEAGAQTLVFEAVDFRGEVIATDRIRVTSSVGDPVLSSLRISEIQYNPAAPTASEASLGFDNNNDFEYVELVNIGSDTLSLADVAFVRTGDAESRQGIDFEFDAAAELGPGESVVVVEDLAAFRARYGDQPRVAGQWSGRLGNDGEQLTLLSSGIVLHQFRYDDDWVPVTDGEGRSLQMTDVTRPDLASWQLAASWRPSSSRLGSPGDIEPSPGDANADGVFNDEDLTALFIVGEYEDDQAGNSVFADGDFDGDGDFTSEDLVWAFRYGLFDPGQAAAREVQLDAVHVDPVFDRLAVGETASAADPAKALSGSDVAMRSERNSN